MKTKPKNFKCESCEMELYGDADVCKNCGDKGTILPMEAKCYCLFLNDVQIGSGSLSFLQSLIHTYVVNNELYHKDFATFEFRAIDTEPDDGAKK